MATGHHRITEPEAMDHGKGRARPARTLRARATTVPVSPSCPVAVGVAGGADGVVGRGVGGGVGGGPTTSTSTAATGLCWPAVSKATAFHDHFAGCVKGTHRWTTVKAELGHLLRWRHIGSGAGDHRRRVSYPHDTTVICRGALAPPALASRHPHAAGRPQVKPIALGGRSPTSPKPMHSPP
ncbi:MAG: hypothetical protein Q9O62_12525 [Ardenticatenia bacterium]|nr:hypothetical protein [Ardenticatenia bacterium]